MKRSLSQTQIVQLIISRVRYMLGSFETTLNLQVLMGSLQQRNEKASTVLSS